MKKTQKTSKTGQNLDYVKSILKLASSTLDFHKAKDIVTIDLNAKASFADYMLIASATSSRHAVSLGRNVEGELKRFGHIQTRTTGAEGGDWVLIDAGDIIIHVFKTEVRQFYNLEKLWQEIQTTD